MTFPVQIGVIGWVIALVALVLIIILIVIGQLAMMPLGLILVMLALSRLI
jgi:hypothetical protein